MQVHTKISPSKYPLAGLNQRGYGGLNRNDTLGSKVFVNLAEIVLVGWGQEEIISNFSPLRVEKFEILSS